MTTDTAVTDIMVLSRQITAAHAALDAAGVCEGGSLETRVGLLVNELNEVVKRLRRDLNIAIRWTRAAENIGKAAGYAHAEVESHPEYFADEVIRLIADQRSHLTAAQPSVCKLVCRQGHTIEHRGLCVEITKAIKGETP